MMRIYETNYENISLVSISYVLRLCVWILINQWVFSNIYVFNLYIVVSGIRKIELTWNLFLIFVPHLTRNASFKAVWRERWSCENHLTIATRTLYFGISITRIWHYVKYCQNMFYILIVHLLLNSVTNDINSEIDGILCTLSSEAIGVNCDCAVLVLPLVKLNKFVKSN